MVTNDADTRRAAIVAQIDASLDKIRATHDALLAMLLTSSSSNGTPAEQEVTDGGDT